MTEKIE